MNYLKVFVFSKDLEFRDSLDFFIVEILHSQNSHTEKIKIRFQLMLTNTSKANLCASLKQSLQTSKSSQIHSKASKTGALWIETKRRRKTIAHARNAV